MSILVIVNSLTEEQQDVEFLCSECLTSCTPTEVDFGIGPYEFWGQVGNHSDIQIVSDCCEATIINYGNVLDQSSY
jgi:hypothetical protein